MERLPNWNLTNSNPAFYDLESKTAVEMVAKLYGVVDDLIGEHNKIATDTKKEINDFIATVEKQLENNHVGYNQMFKDFIDVVELRITKQNNDIAEANKYMREKIVETAREILSKVMQSEIVVEYDEETENINISLNVNGGD